MIEEGDADVYHTAFCGRNALMEAARAGQTACILPLLAAGADVNAVNEKTGVSYVHLIKKGHFCP